MSMILDGTSGLTTPGVVNTAGETIATTLSVTGATNLAVSSGNVGIGTASPSYKLDVSGQVRASSGSTASALIATSTNAGGTALNVQNSGTVNMLIGGYNSIVGSGNATDVMLSAVQGVLAFGNGASSTERMRIDSSGNLLVGTTADPTASVSGVKITNPGTVARSRWSCGTITTTNNMIAFCNGNGDVGTISVNGSATTYATSSDYRLKEAIAPMTGALAKVVALKPCTYKWKVDGSDGQGFIAHELDEVVSGCVTGAKDAVDADGNPQYQGIDTSFLVATLTAAIQEQQALITQLQADVAALKALSA